MFGWMMQHLAPQLAERTRRRFLPFGLDHRVFVRCASTIVKALEGGRQLSRPKVYERLERAGIRTAGRGLHILWQMAHEGLICFGTREGKQHTFVLLEEWVPKAKRLDRDEALAELARRYFTSHGPATLQDFTWWSGLPAADARRGVEAARVKAPHLAPPHPAPPHPAPRTSSARTSHHVVLLPPYDEYTVAYQRPQRGAGSEARRRGAQRHLQPDDPDRRPHRRHLDAPADEGCRRGRVETVRAVWRGALAASRRPPPATAASSAGLPASSRPETRPSHLLLVACQMHPCRVF